MRKLRSILGFVLLAALAAALPAKADDGFFSAFFDRNAQQCTGSISSGGIGTLYVLLVPNGATYAGIRGAELRVTSSSPDLIFTSESHDAEIGLGTATADGITLGYSTCRTGNPIQVLRLQALVTGPARDVEVRVSAKRNPSSSNFQCPVAVLCDDPVFTQVCASGGKAIVNPSTTRPCGSGRESSEWTRVKEFYR